MNFLQDKKDEIYALGRIVFGFLFMLHGLIKLVGGNQGMPEAAFWIAALVETIGGAMIMVGLMGQMAAFVSSGLMAVAFFWMHFELSAALFTENPLLNNGEPAVLY